MRSADVARVGYDAMIAGKALAIPGVANKIGAQSVRFVPRRVAARIAGAIGTLTVDAAIQAAHRVRRHALQRLADPEERPHRAGRDRPRDPEARDAASSSCTDLAGPTPASTRSRRSRTSSSTPDSRPSRSAPDQRRAAGRHHILTIDKAPHRFHARHDAVSRSYLYQISRRRTAFGKPFVWWIREPLDLGAMREAAARVRRHAGLRGLHDDDPEEKSTPCARRARRDLVEAGALMLVRVQGSHFLWKMVRRIVGVLAAVGRGEMTPEDAAQYLNPRDDGLIETSRHRSPHRPRDCFSRKRCTRRRRWARPDSTGDRAGLTRQRSFCLRSPV